MCLSNGRSLKHRLDRRMTEDELEKTVCALFYWPLLGYKRGLLSFLLFTKLVFRRIYHLHIRLDF